MNPIYYDGTKYYKVGKHKDGSYVKFEVDNVGTYKKGGCVHKYGGHLDMNMDVNKMYQVGGQIDELPTYQGTPGQSSYINPAIQFTEGFETNRGYSNKGYTNETDPRNMSQDYDYLLDGIPEPLQVVLLDAGHNQSNIAGTMLLALAKSDPVKYQTLIMSGAIPGLPTNTPMQNAMLLNDIDKTGKGVKGYNASPEYKAKVYNILKGNLVGAYENNPIKMVDDITKSRIQRNSSFYTRNENAADGGNKMAEWSERSLASAQYAKDLIAGNAKEPDYYYDITKNKGKFRYDADKIREKASGQFPGDASPNAQNWYNDIETTYDNIVTPKVKQPQIVNPNIEVPSITTPNVVDNSKLDNHVVQNFPSLNNLNLSNNSVNSGNNRTDFNKNNQIVYNDGTNHYIINQDNSGRYSKIQIDSSGNSLSNGINKTYNDANEMESDLANMYELVKDDGSSNIASTIPSIKNNQSNTRSNNPFNNIGNKIKQTVDNTFRDNNPYKETYSDEQKSIDEQRAAMQDYRLKNQAQIKEMNLQRKDANLNTRLNKQADRNLFLEAKEKAVEPIVDRRAMNRTLNNVSNTEKRIAKMQKLNQKRLSRIPELQFQNGGNLPKFQGKPGQSGYFFNNANTTYNVAPNEISYDDQSLLNIDTNKPNYNWYGNNDKYDVGKGGSYSDDQGVSRDAYGNALSGNTTNKLDLSNVNKFNFKVNPTTNTNVTSSSLGTSNHQAFNPRKLTTYGDRIAENALNRTTGYNLARSLELARREPLIIPEFKFKKQFAQADFNPVYEMQNVGMRNYANNSRSTAALMGNLQQLNANMVKAKSKIAGDAQTQQRAYDATFAGQQQDWQNKLAQARQNVEDKNTAHEAEKFNFLSDTMTNWEKADQQRAKLYNANLQNWNKLNTYVNQLSPEYQAVRDKEGVVKIVFKANPNQEVPAEQLAKRQAEYEARFTGKKYTPQTGTYSGTYDGTKPIMSPKPFKNGGKTGMSYTPTTNKIKKLRTGLY